MISTGVTTALASLPGSSAAQAVAYASDGFLYVTAGNVIYKQNPSSGAVTTVATLGVNEGLGGITTDTSGNAYVVAWDGVTLVTRIAKVVISSGVTTTLVADGLLPSYRLSSLFFMGGYLYVGGQNDFALRRYTTAGVGGITAGAGSSGHADGIAAKSWFTSIAGVTGDGTNLFVADDGISATGGLGNYVRKIVPGTALTDTEPATVTTAVTVDYGTVTTVAGNGSQGTAAGTGPAAGFNNPDSVTYLNGALYVAGLDAVSKVIPATGVTTVPFGIPGSPGCPTLGLLGSSVHLPAMQGLTTDGSFLYGITQTCGGEVLRFDPVTTAISHVGTFIDGANGQMVLGPDKALYATKGVYIDRLSLVDGASTRFATVPASGPTPDLSGIAADATALYALGGVSVAGVQNKQIFKVAISTGTSTTLGSPSTALTSGPITLAGARIYASGTSDSLVSVNKTTGAISNVAGGFYGYADLTGASAQFYNVYGIVSDGNSVFVADSGSNRLRRVRTVAGQVAVGETYGTALMDLTAAQGDDDSGALRTSLASMQSLTVGRADPVNTATGAFTRQETDLTFPGAGTTLNFTRTYTSIDPATGRLGTGWTDPYQSSLSFDGPGNATYRSEDGATVIFAKTGATYTPPAGVTATLAAISGGYTVTTFDQQVTTFNSAGQMTKTVDAHGKGLTFGYTGAQQTSITDNAGRVVTLGYTGSLLTSLTLADGRHVNYGYTGIVLTSVRNLGGHTTTLNYDTSGYLSTEIDALTNTLFTNTYDPATARVTQQVNATGQTTTFGWTASTQTATTTAPDGGVTTDVYKDNVLVQSTDPAGGVTLNSYDASGNLIEVDDPLGRVTTLTYDTRGNLLTRTLNGALTTTWTYNTLNEPLTVKDPLGHITTSTYNAIGDKLSQADAMSPPATTTWTYNADGTVATMVDPRGNVAGGTPSAFTTSYGYDTAANQTSVTTPLGFKTGYGYDSNGRQTAAVDPRGYVSPNTPAQFTTTTTYYDNNLPDVVTDPLGHATTNVYNVLDQLGSVTNDAGKVTSYTYDGAGNRLTVTDPLIHTTTTSYDYAGRTIGVTDADGNKTTTAYDTRGNQATVTDPRGNVAGTPPAVAATFTTTYGYDADDEQVSVSHPLTATITATSTTTYDTFGRVIKVTDANGHATQTSYDNGGNIATTTDANNNVTHYTSYDNDNRLLSLSDPLSHITSYTYDVDGHVLTRKDPSLRVTTSTFDNDGRLATSISPDSPALTTTTGYDAANHVTAVGYSDGTTHSVTAVFDAAGRRTSMVDGTGTTTSGYDNLNRPTSVTDGAGHVVGYGYDDVGRLTTLTYPGTSRVVAYGYTSAGLVHTVNDWLGHTTTVSQDPAGNITSVAYPNAVTDSRTYDMDGRLAAIVDTESGPSTLATFGYTYDKATELLTDNAAITGQAADNRGYTYYNGNQIKTTPNGTYTLDAAEELKTAPASSGTTPTINYDAAGQIATTVTAGVTTTYTYNARGDRTAATPSAGTATTLGYNQADNLTSYTKGTTTASYSYNGDGLRMSATANGAPRSYTWNSIGSLPVLLDDGTNTFVYGPNGPLEQINDTTGTISYLLADHQASTRLITDSAGAISGTYAYDAYGNPTHTGSATTALTYTGQYADPTSGYQYLRARDYDAVTAQFLTVDSELGTTRDAFGYVGNDPINRTDPSGKCLRIDSGPCVNVKTGLPAKPYQAPPPVYGPVYVRPPTFLNPCNQVPTFLRPDSCNPRPPAPKKVARPAAPRPKTPKPQSIDSGGSCGIYTAMCGIQADVDRVILHPLFYVPQHVALTCGLGGSLDVGAMNTFAAVGARSWKLLARANPEGFAVGCLVGPTSDAIRERF